MLFAEPAETTSQIKQLQTWDTEFIFCDGDDYFAAFCAAIRAAQKFVYLESYIFEFDTLGRRVTDELLRARQRGVEVKIIIDGVGSANLIGQELNELQEKGLDVRVHHPLPWQIVPRLIYPRFLTWRTLLRLFSYANSRNHRKMLIVDGNVAFVGSLNVSEVHLKEVLDVHAWHDIGAVVRGQVCESLQLLFQKAWNKAWRRAPNGFLMPPIEGLSKFVIPETPLVVRNDGRLLRKEAFTRRLQLFRAARRRIWIANAYFLPSSQLLRALMAASKRGVDVRIVLPKISDVRFMPWISRSFYESLIKYGVRVYEYTPSVLHAKAMLVDQCAWVGSSNLNHRSLLHDLELDVVLSSRVALGQLEKIFEDDFQKTHEIDKMSRNGRPLLQRVTVSLLLYFRHLL